MARYFNQTSGSVAVTLRRGGSVYIPAKRWMEIPAEDESSADLVRALRLKHLVRLGGALPVESETPATSKPSARKVGG